MHNIKLSFKDKVLIPIIAIFITSVLIISANSYRLLDSVVRNKTNENLEIFTNNILSQASHLNVIFTTTTKTLNDKHLALTKSIVHILDNTTIDMSSKALQAFIDPLDVLEINIADSDGVLTHSNIEEFIGFRYSSTEFTQIYLDLINGTKTDLIEEPRLSITNNDKQGALNHYTGVSRVNGNGFIQLGFDTKVLDTLQDEISIKKAINTAKLGETGFGMILVDGKIYAHPKENMTNRNVTTEDWFLEVTKGKGFMWITFGNEKYYIGFNNENGYTVIGLIPESEYNKELNQVMLNNLIFFTISLAAMIAAICIIMNRLLMPIKNITKSLGEIGNGNFDTRVEGEYSDEFALIQRAINDMVVSVTEHLHDKLAAERVAHELKLAKLDLALKVYYDALTGVYNRRYLDENLDIIIGLLSPTKSHLSILMIDIDFFKRFNDTYGHSAGDECLRKVAGVFKDAVKRKEDFVARYGGEEFVIILPNTCEIGAQVVAQGVLDNVIGLGIPNEKSEASDVVTVSIGIVTKKAEYSNSGTEYLDMADKALYKSKRSGRNRYSS